ncbi:MULTISPECIES: undecaprenyl-diphosphate phosphatase [unclassified Mesorhizobium]|uniref:undecaprenyl-diphosphate phosphatase n=1 Tax=unclassified Mesorhizobium TaxID=325217 RepID=UPI0033367A05
MGWSEAAILGVVQGLTEFLPISSSAHLRIVGEFLPPAGDPGAAFTAITQIGTEIAVLIYFRHDIICIIATWLRSLAGRRERLDPDARMGWLVIIGTPPIAILGLLLKNLIEGPARNLYLTATMLIVFALVLAAADRLGPKRKALRDLGWRDGFLFGAAQAMALIPGVSRSGGTISAGLLMGYTREAAARYSFLLAIPAVLASGFFQLYASWGADSPVGTGPTALATLLSFAVGYVAIAGFLKLVSTRSYIPFVYYRIGLGASIFLLLGAGLLSAS